MAKKFSRVMTSVRVPKAWIADIDDLVKSGVFESRGDAVRRAIDWIGARYLDSRMGPRDPRARGGVSIKVELDLVDPIRCAGDRGQLGPFTNADEAIRLALFMIIEEAKKK